MLVSFPISMREFALGVRDIAGNRRCIHFRLEPICSFAGERRQQNARSAIDGLMKRNGGLHNDASRRQDVRAPLPAVRRFREASR